MITAMPDTVTKTVRAGELREGDRFSYDGGVTWLVAVPKHGALSARNADGRVFMTFLNRDDEVLVKSS